jgi:hypothetical protein
VVGRQTNVAMALLLAGCADFRDEPEVRYAAASSPATASLYPGVCVQLQDVYTKGPADKLRTFVLSILPSDYDRCAADYNLWPRAQLLDYLAVGERSLEPGVAAGCCHF